MVHESGPLTGELPRVSLDDTGGPPRPQGPAQRSPHWRSVTSTGAVGGPADPFFNRQAWAAYEKKEYDMVKAAGTEFVEVDKKSFQDVMGPVYDKFANTPDLKRLVKAVQDTK